MSIKTANSNLNKTILIFVVVLMMMACVAIPATTPVSIASPTPLPAAQIHIKDVTSWKWTEIPVPVIKPFSQHPQVLIDLKGRIHLLWDTLGGSDNAFIYHSYFDAGQWTSPKPIASTLGTSSIVTAPLATPDGAIHVLWYNQLQLGGPYRLMYAKYDGANWSPEVELYRSDKDPNLSGSLFSDSQSVVHAVIRVPKGLGSDFLYLTNTTNGWQIQQSILPQGLNDLIMWKYEFDSDGGVRLYGRDLNGQLNFAYWKNNAATTQQTNITLKMYDHDFGDNLGNYYIYRIGDVPIPGGTTTGVYSQCIDTNLTLWPEQLLSGENKVVTAPQIAQSASRTVMSWITSDNQVQFLFPKGCGKADLFTLPLPKVIFVRQSLSLAISDLPNKLCILNRAGEFEMYCADMQ